MRDLIQNIIKKYKIVLIITVSFCCFFISALPGKCGDVDDYRESVFARERESAYCSYVIDGDTIIVNERIKVRLIGIDTPETGEQFYKEAKEFMIKSAAKKKVMLDYDKRKKDKYGRTLAYVYLPDGTLLNRELVKKGLAEVFYKEDFRLKKEFLGLQKEAKKNKLGIWSK